MIHPGVGGDHSGTRRLRVEPWRAHQLAAKEDDESAHGVALTTLHIESGRRKGALEQTKACLHKAWALFLVTL
jgi:hypothetical protein